jgi:glycosyltransferase involved in cell wall biosynthesis
MDKTVIQFADYGGSYGGNFIASIVSLNTILKLSNWRQVFVFTDVIKNKKWVESLANYGIPIYFVSKKSRIKLTKAVYEIVNRENAQILHTHFSAFDFPAWAAKRLRRLNGHCCEVIWHVHSPFPRKSSLANRLKDAIRFTIARDLYQIVVSEGGLQNLLDRGISLTKTVVIPNGIDLKHAIQTTETPDSIRRHFSLDKGNVVLLQLGWEPIRKGVDISLRAVESLVNQGLKVGLLLVGTELLHQYVDGVYSSSPPAWLTILPFTEHIANYFQVADVFVSASRAEGLPYSVAETMFYGLPVISSDIRGLEWAHASPGVLFFPNEDVKGLEAAIINVTKLSHNEKKGLISQNRKLVANEHSIAIWGERIASLYEKIICG